MVGLNEEMPVDCFFFGTRLMREQWINQEESFSWHANRLEILPHSTLLLTSDSSWAQCEIVQKPVVQKKGSIFWTDDCRVVILGHHTLEFYE